MLTVLFDKNHKIGARKIINAILLFWLAAITSSGTCVAAEKGHTEKYTVIGADAIDALRYIREEVRLARDLYRALSDIWRLDVFENTAKSKQSLINAVSILLKQYGIDDPAGDACKFVNPDLQELYSYLIDRGKVSRNNAVDVAILIERTVIADLNETFLHTKGQDIHEVLTLIMEGSENDLHALDRYLVLY